jgi:transcriptional antiterminator RfaH
MNGENEKYWWLVKTKARQEEKAEFHLNNQEYTTYRPMAKRLRKQRGKVKTTIESLFPGYLFIQLDLTNDDWAPIRSTYGVLSIVAFGKKPTRVPDQVINELISKQDLLFEKAIDLDRYKEGDKVVIEKEGAYHGMKAIFQSYDGDHRTFILLNILKTQAVLNISEDDISPY